MRAELRADGLHISGYVNVPGRKSKPVMTPHGRVIEVIEQRAFAKAIERADNIRMLLDHDQNRVLASTQANTLEVKEDAVGLRAESVVTDPEVIEGAKAGRLRGWSFNIKNPKDTIEQRADGLPIRHITDLDMDEITLAMNRIPVYSSTSIEVRADTEDGEAVELRSEIPEKALISLIRAKQGQNRSLVRQSPNRHRRRNRNQKQSTMKSTTTE